MAIKPTRSEDPYEMFHSGAGSDYGPMAMTEYGQPLEQWKLRAKMTGHTIHASASGDSGGDVVYGDGAQDVGGDYGDTGGDSGAFTISGK